jgi:spermidine synthase
MDLWYTEKTGKSGLTLQVRETLFRGQSEFQDVAILDTYDYGRMLTLDGLVMTTERDEFVYHEMIAHVPMTAHPNPRRVLVVGGGDGGTVREVLRHAGVEQVDLCEIDGMVIEQSRKWLPTIAGALDDPRVTIHVRDAVAFVAEKTDAYDVILIDSTDPIGPGEGLFTEAFYRDCLRALTSEGILAAQTESPFAMPDAFARAYSKLYKVFPVVNCYFGIIPTYPGNLWTWSFCSKLHGPFDQLATKDLASLEETSRYYNADLHRGAFALPTYVRRMLNEIKQGTYAPQALA